MAELHYEITGSSSQLEQTFSRVRQSTQQLTRDMEQSGASIEDMFTRVKNAAAMAAAGFSAQQLVKNVAQVRGEFQQLEMAFKTMLGSESQANALMQQMVQTAATTPFDLQGVANGAKSLLAYGLEADKVNDTLIRLGDIAAGLSIPLNDIVYLYGTTMVQGRLYTQDLNQFTGRGIPMIGELAKQFGVAESEVKNLVTEGKVGFPEVQKAIESLTSEGGKFGGLMSAQSATIAGQKANLDDNIDMMKNEVGEIFQDEISDSIEIVGKLVENWQTVAKSILPVVTAIGSYKATMLIVAAAQRQQAAEQTAAHAKRITELDEETKKLKEQAYAKQDLLDADSGNASPVSAKAKAASRSTEEDTAAAGKKLAEQEAINASLDAEIAKRTQIAQQELAEATQRHTDSLAELDLADQENIQAQEALSKAIERKNQADDRVKAAQEYLDVVKETSEYEGSDGGDDELQAYAEMEAAAKEQAAAATELETATERANTTEKRLNDAAIAEQTAATEMNTAQKRVNTLSTAQNTTAEVTNTTAENLGTVAKIKAGLATAANTIKTRLATTAQLLYRAAIQSVTNAWNTMKVAMATNPIGLIITALTTAISLFYTIKDSTEEATEAEKKFGEEAAKTLTNVNTLYAVVNSAEKSSQTYKQAMKELTGICEQYGLQLDKEKDLLGQVNEARTTLNYLIAQEGVERQHANNLSNIQKQYEEELKEIQEDIADEIGSGNEITDAAIAGQITQAVEANINGVKDAMLKYKEVVARTKNDTSDFASMVRSDAWEAYEKALEGVIQRTLQLNEIEDKNGEKAKDITNDIKRKAIAQGEASKATQDAIKAEEAAYAANKQAAEGLDNLSSAQQLAARKAQAATSSVSDLNSEIANLIKEYGYNIIDFEVRLKTGGIPQWMKDYLNLGSKKNTQADLDKAKERELYYTNLAKKAKGHKGINVTDTNTGKKTYYSAEEVTYDAWLYGQAAQQIQANLDEQKKTVAPDKKKKKTKTGKTEAEKQAETDKKIAEENHKWEEQEAERERKYKEQAQQTTIDVMAEGSDKTIAQLQFDHKKQLAEIDQEAEEIKKARVEHAKALFEADYKNEDKDFYKSSQYTKANQLTGEDEAYLQKLRESENADYKRKLDEQTQAAEQSMRDYLKAYGSFQQQREAIAEEYDLKISKAENDGQRMSLEAEKQKALSDLDASKLKDSINWNTVFNDLDKMSVEYLQNLKAQLQAFLDAHKDMPVESIKEIAEKMREIDNTIDAQDNHFAEALPKLYEYIRAKKEAQQAQDNATSAGLGSIGAQADVQSARMRIQAALLGMGVKADTSQITTANQANLTKGITGNNLQRLNSLFKQLSDSETKAGKATEKAIKAQNDADEAQDKATLNLKERAAIAAEAFDFVGNKLGQLSDIAGELGIGENTIVGSALKNGSAAFTSASQAAASFASGDYLGAALNGISAIKSLGKVFGIGNGSNAKEVAETTERLTESNEHLQTAIEGLKDEILEYNGMKAVQAGEEAKQAQQQVNEQTMEILKTQMGYHGKHHSNAYYWNLSASDYAAMNAALAEYAAKNPNAETKTDTANSLADIYELTPEQMDYIRTHNVELWEAMITQGEYDKSEYWENYADLAGAMEEITDSVKEKITNTTFDSLRSSFVSTLSDMSSDGQDFADDFSEQLFNAVLNAQIGNLLDKDLQEFYDTWAQLGEDGLTKDDITDLQEQYQKLVDKGLEIRDQAAAITGYDAVSERQQSGESKSWEGMSQDDASELNGRFTALQIAGESIQQSNAQIAQGILQTMNFVQQLTLSSEQLTLLAVERNDYLNTIATLTKKYFASYDSRLANIETNTAKI